MYLLKKEKQESIKQRNKMPRTIKPINIRAPSRYLVGLRFKNKCLLCGKEIPITETLCKECKKNKIA